MSGILSLGSESFQGQLIDFTAGDNERMIVASNRNDCVWLIGNDMLDKRRFDWL